MSRFARNTLALIAFAALDGLLGWVQLKWLALHLGVSGMGVFAALFSLGSVLTLAMGGGLTLMVTRYTAAFEAEGRPAEAAHVAVRSLAVALGLGALLSGLGFAWCRAGGTLPGPLAGGTRVLPWVVLFFAATNARQFLYAVWNGRRRMEIPAAIDLLQIGAVTARLFVRPALDLEGFFRWNAWTSLLATALSTGALLPGLLPNARTALGRDERGLVRRYGAWSNLVAVTGVGFDYLDRLLLVARLSAAQVSYFHVPARWLQFLRRLLAQPLAALFPELARVPAAGRMAALSAGLEMFSLAGLGAALMLLLSPAAFIHLLSSAEFDPGIPLLRILAFVPPIMGIYAPLTTALRASGSMRQGAASDVLWVLIYLGTGMALLGPFGPRGMAMGQVAASLAALGWNVGAGLREGWLRMPWAMLAKQWALAAAAYAAARIAGLGGEGSFLPALAGGALFVMLCRFAGGLSRGARSEIAARLPGRWQAAFRKLAGSF